MALTKAVIVNLDAPATAPIPVLFNPPRYTLAKTNRFAEIKIPGLASSVLQFVGGDAGTVSLELFFDTTDTGIDVRAHTATIASLMDPDRVTHSPPRLLVLWGTLAFQCFLISVRQEFDYFNAQGVPLRALLVVEFKGQDTLDHLAATTGAQPGQATRYVAKSDDTLQSIAHRVGNDPGKWRQIAAANNIDDPRAITPGMKLKIPRLS